MTSRIWLPQGASLQDIASAFHLTSAPIRLALRPGSRGDVLPGGGDLKRNARNEHDEPSPFLPRRSQALLAGNSCPQNSTPATSMDNPNGAAASLRGDSANSIGTTAWLSAISPAV